MTLEKLKQFFTERPQLTPFGFALEAKVSPRGLDYLLKGRNGKQPKLTENMIKKLLPIMIKYGYKE